LPSPLKGKLKGVAIQVADSEHTKKLNARLQQRVDRELEEIRKELDDPSQATIEIDCRHRFSAGFLGSVGCDVYRSAGGPYPDLGYFAFNVWTCGDDVQEVGLDELCSQVSDCKPRLQRVVAKHFQAAKIGELWSVVEESRSYGEEPLSAFVFGKNALIFSFRKQLPHVADAEGIIAVPRADAEQVLQQGSIYRDISTAIGRYAKP
jgi:hypothetical protein